MKKRLFYVLAAIALVATLMLPATAASAGNGQNSTCVTIQDGILTYPVGHYLYPSPLQTGFDPYGYNYQGRYFKGSYANVYLGRDGLPPYQGDAAAYLSANPSAANKWYWPYRDDQVLMKWDDGWLSNKDCDGDGALDRHYGYPSYIGSGGWETNHQSGEYIGDNGKTYKWNYFCKIVSVPAGAYFSDANKNGRPDDYVDVWYTAVGAEIGPSIWSQFAIIEEVYNDQGTGDHGLLYKSPTKAGVGNW